MLKSTNGLRKFDILGGLSVAYNPEMDALPSGELINTKFLFNESLSIFLFYLFFPTHHCQSVLSHAALKYIFLNDCYCCY